VVLVAEKKSFVLYCDYKNHFSLLSPEDQGRLLMAIFDYVESGAEPQLEAMPLMAFSFIRAQLDRDLESYRETCKRRAEAGRRSGEARRAKAEENKQDGTKRTSVQCVQQTEQEGTKRTDNDTVTVNVNENVNVNDNVINFNNIGNSGELQKKKSTRFVPPTVEDVKIYCQERKNSVNPETFVDFYTAKGWMVGKNKMKDWKSAVRTWERSRQNGSATAPKRDYDSGDQVPW
jgi:hypothetical protein